MIKQTIAVAMLLSCFLADAETNLTPDKAVDLALQNNGSLRASGYAVLEKDQARKEAMTGFLAQVSGNAFYRRVNDVPSFDLSALFPGGGMEMGSKDNYSLGINVTQPIFTGFNIIRAYSLAKKGYEAAEFDNRKNEQLIAYGALSLFWTSYTLQKMVEVLENTEAQLAKLSADQQKLFEQKMLAEYDYLQIRASHAKMKVEVIRSTRQSRSMLRNLAVFIGLDPDDPVKLTPDSAADDVKIAQSLEDYIAFVKENRPDLKQARKTEEMAATAASMAKTGYLPSVAASFDYTYARPNQSVSFMDEWNDSWSIMIIARWNLFDFGASYRKGRQAEYRRQALALINADAERNAVTQAMDAWAAVDESRSEFEAMSEAAKASEMSFNAAKLKYAQGMASTFEYLSAQTTLTQARFEEMNALVKFKLAIENMKIGGLGGTQAASMGGQK